MRLPVVHVLAALLLVAGCGDDGDRETGTAALTEATVSQVLEDPDAFQERPVLIRGQAYPAGNLGFVLEENGRAIFVAHAPGEGVQGLAAGETVAVRGELSEVSETESDTLREAVDAVPPQLQDAIDDEDVAPGKPFLNLRTVYGEGEEPPSVPASP